MFERDDRDPPNKVSGEDGSALEETRLASSGAMGASAAGLGELESLVVESGSGHSLAHFRLLEEIGRGGMGTVYRALDTLLDRQVAIKVIADEIGGAPEFQERFVREAKIVARLNHPNIPQIFFIGRAEGRLFFAMEWIEGRTVQALIGEGPMPAAQALDMVMQAAAALKAAHAAGIIHRDIKPSNLMLTREGVLKVLDFGIARSAGFQGDATMTGSFMGTPHYASPEQARGAKVDGRSDIYSLGATLYELLSGRRPFEGDNSLQVLTDRLVKKAPALEVGGELTPGLCALVARMLATDPQDRFPDAGALLEAMRAAYPAPPVPADLSRRIMAFLTDILLAGAPCSRSSSASGPRRAITSRLPCMTRSAAGLSWGPASSPGCSCTSCCWPGAVAQHQACAFMGSLS